MRKYAINCEFSQIILYFRGECDIIHTGLLRLRQNRKGRINMAVSYKKLWHLLIDKDMKKKDLQEAANLTSHAMRKLSHDEAITTDILAKICRCLDCKVDDIMDVIELEDNQELNSK